MGSIFASTQNHFMLFDIISRGLRVGFIPLWHLQGTTVIGWFLKPFHKCSSSEKKEKLYYYACLYAMTVSYVNIFVA